MVTVELTDHRLRDRLAAELARARTRTLGLTDVVDDEDLLRQHSPLMSPLVWDLAHIGNQEEQWLIREVGGRAALRADIDQVYDAFRHARADRPALPLLDPNRSRAYVRSVREQVLDILDRTPLDGRRLTADGLTFAMIVQHEQQHAETMLATHQLRRGAPVLSASPPPSTPPVADPAAEVFVPGGPFEMGTSLDPWALDNERPAHRVEVASFLLDKYPVTNGRYLRFIDEDGYRRPELWTAAGWRHITENRIRAPRFWRRDGDRWFRRVFGTTEPIVEAEPVVHVSYHEARAFARWAGRRLPTEAEWEKAARFDPVSGRSRRYPWGDAEPTAAHANLGQRHLRPAPIGAYPRGVSAFGAHQLIGDVWEWTSDDMAGYPGFTAFPYREYSEVFFGPEYKVLRGGAFSADAAACRGTFRNWDHPIRRQIFSGLRCARDAAPGDRN